MMIRKRFVIFGLIVALAIAAYFAVPSLYSSYAVERSLREQGLHNQGAKPLFDAVVTKKLNIGDSLEHVKTVLGDAGLGFTVERWKSMPPMVYSIYRASSESGFSIHIELDESDRVAKVDIQQYFTGP